MLIELPGALIEREVNSKVPLKLAMPQLKNTSNRNTNYLFNHTYFFIKNLFTLIITSNNYSECEYF